MASKREELKRITQEKKALLEQQKAIKEELSKGKEERKEARTTVASVRRTIKAKKAELRELAAKSNSILKNRDPEEISSMADSIMEISSELAGAYRKVAENISLVDGL